MINKWSKCSFERVVERTERLALPACVTQPRKAVGPWPCNAVCRINLVQVQQQRLLG
jgi:hypothetical protein